MSVIAWGKPNIFVQKIGTEKNEWIKLDTPKEGTTELSPSKGDTMEAKEEGGGIVDRKVQKSTYELAYQLFVKKDIPQPFKTMDGIIDGNFRIAVQPEDATIPGIYMGNTTIGAEESLSSTDGSLITYTHSGLIPDGDAVAKTSDNNGDDVYCALRWRIITATKGSGNKYSLVFKHPYGDSAGEVITESYSS